MLYKMADTTGQDAGRAGEGQGQGRPVAGSRPRAATRSRRPSASMAMLEAGARLCRGAGALGLVHPQPGAGEPAPLPSQGGPGDAVIALTANKAAREGRRIDFKEEWFDPESDETPEGEKPDLSQYSG